MGMKDNFKMALGELKLLMEETDHDDDQSEPLALAADAGDCAVITASTTLTGDLSSGESVSVFGVIHGNLSSAQLVLLEGKVEGDVTGSHILLRGATVKGSLVARGSLVMDADTVVAGNICAQSATIAGKVKGNIDALGRVVLKSGAYVVGDVGGGAFFMEEGARLSGYVKVHATSDGAPPEFPEVVIE